MSKDDEIRYEEAYVGWAHQMLSAMIQRARERPGTAGDVGTSRALQRNSEAVIKRLRGAEGEILFGRIDMDSDETHYIGKVPIDGANSWENAVIDWRAPLGECFYQATTSQRAGIGRRRTISLHGRTVRDFNDELLLPDFRPPVPQLEVPEPPPFDAPVPDLMDSHKHLQKPSPELEPTNPPVDEFEEATAQPEVETHQTEEVESATTATEAQSDEARVESHKIAAAEEPEEPAAEQEATWIDEFDLRAGDILLHELQRARSGVMGEIVATIQADQDRLIRADPDAPLVIQGGPGTGKTVVALHRAAWVIYQQRERNFEQSVLVIGPNGKFLDYIRRVLPTLGERTATQLTVDGLALSQLPAGEQRRTTAVRNDDLELERLKGDIRMTEVIARAVWSYVKPQQVELGFGRFILRLAVEDVESMVERSWFAKLSYNDARREFVAQAIDAFADRYVHRVGPTTATGDQHEQIARSVREYFRDSGIVTQIFPPVSARAVVRRLMADRGFRESAADDLTHDELQRFDTEPSRKRQYRWSVADIPLIGEAAFVLSGAPDRYSHVIIDEAQDLSPMQWRMIRRRTAGRSMTIAGDLAQATSAWTPDTWSDVRRWAKLGKHLDVSELSLGYRVPIPIMEYAGRLLAYCAPAVNLPQSFRPGVDPVAHRVESSNVIDTALEIAHRWSDLPGSLAIICPPSLETKIRNAVTESDLPDSVEVVNDTVVKGLEFDRILVLEPSLIARGGINGLRRLYICLTRATQELAVVHSQDLPDELGQPEDQQRQEQAVELRSRQREKQLKAPTGSKIWRGQVADEYPHAYRRWSSEEEALLRDELTRGMSVLEISEAHRRRPGGITSRIKKLGLKVDWNMRDLLGQSDQPDFGERPEQQHRPVEAPLDSSLTLHDALKVVINDKGNRWMSAKELAEEVNRLGLYKPSDGTPLDAKQVNARVRNYQAVFVRGDERIRLRDEPKD